MMEPLGKRGIGESSKGRKRYIQKSVRYDPDEYAMICEAAEEFGYDSPTNFILNASIMLATGLLQRR
jgi:uncharacterized protein (DUF1778 family)